MYKNIVYKHYITIHIACMHTHADCIRMYQMSPSGRNIVDTQYVSNEYESESSILILVLISRIQTLPSLLEKNVVYFS